MPRHKFADTRQRIEQAALRLFVEKGVAETSVRDLARAVDISEGALYRHFDSKDHLVRALFEHHYGDFAGTLKAVGDRSTSARDKIAAMIAEFCRAHDENPTRFRFMLFVQYEQLHKLQAEARTPVQVVRATLASAIAAGQIPDQSPDLATAILFGIVLEPVQFAAYGQLPSRMSALCDRLVAAAWAALTTVEKSEA